MKYQITFVLLLGLIACGDDDARQPDTGAASDVGTNPDVPATTDSGPTPDDAGASDATTVADAGPRGAMCPAAEMCNPVLNTGCEAGQGCFIAGNAMMSMTLCAAVGDIAMGEACTTAEGCAPGLSCLGGICTPVCCGGSDADCPAGGVCRGGVNIDGVGSCLFPDDCDLLAQTGCDAGENCYPLSPDGGTRCDVSGGVAIGAACTSSNQCAGGSICLDDDICHALCEMGGADVCGEGLQCLGLNGFDDVGVCATPG